MDYIKGLVSKSINVIRNTNFSSIESGLYDGQVLYANSSVGYDTHIEEYKKGRRTAY